MRSTANVYTLPEGLHGHCLSAVLGDPETHTFLVGTRSSRQPNQVHMLRYEEDQNRIEVMGAFAHEAGEIWAL